MVVSRRFLWLLIAVVCGRRILARSVRKCSHQLIWAQRDKDLYKEQSANQFYELPGLLEFYGYVFFFPSFLAGPSMEFSAYRAYINMSMFEKEVCGTPLRTPLRPPPEASLPGWRSYNRSGGKDSQHIRTSVVGDWPCVPGTSHHIDGNVVLSAGSSLQRRVHREPAVGAVCPLWQLKRRWKLNKEGEREGE